MNKPRSKETSPADRDQGAGIVDVQSLSANSENPFLLAPGTTSRGELARFLGVREIRKLRFQGTLSPEGRASWRLRGELGATVVQNCVVTSRPVTTRMDVALTRLFVKDPGPAPQASEVEFDGNDEIELLGDQIDLGQVMEESLALELPQYPHAPDVHPGDFTISPPGSDPISPEETKPFASLAELRDKLSKKRR